jgi:hypothetical protein
MKMARAEKSKTNSAPKSEPVDKAALISVAPCSTAYAKAAYASVHCAILCSLMRAQGLAIHGASTAGAAALSGAGADKGVPFPSCEWSSGGVSLKSRSLPATVCSHTRSRSAIAHSWHFDLLWHRAHPTESVFAVLTHGRSVPTVGVKIVVACIGQ